MAEGLQRPLASLFGRQGDESVARYAISMEGCIQVVAHCCALTYASVSSAGWGQCLCNIPRGLHTLRATCGLQDKD